MSFQVDNPLKVITECKQVLIEVLGFRQLGFDSISKSGNYLAL